jgi:hypothetical protein
MTYIDATGNPTLSCIDVDDSLFTTAVWIPGSNYEFDNYSFSTNCGLPCSNSNTFIGEFDNSQVNLFPNPSNDNITVFLSNHSNGQIVLTYLKIGYVIYQINIT